jgi:hypothetical protein
MVSLEAFLGKNPVVVKVKGKKEKILVDFAEIRIPVSIVKTESFEQIEQKYKCTLKLERDQVSIMPSFVKEYDLLSTSDRELLAKLKDWFNENSRALVSEFIEID